MLYWTVAKHYMTSRSSFNDTARYWTEIYAGGPPSKGSSSEQRDEVAIAGLEKAHVDQFEALGFERSKVVSGNLRPPPSAYEADFLPRGSS